MRRYYKYDRLPEGYCKLAIAAWKVLNDCELFEIEGKLVFTDDVESYLAENASVGYTIEVFDCHIEFERWLLNCIAKWIEHDPLMIDDMNEYIKLA